MNQLFNRARTIAIAVFFAVVILLPAERAARKAHAQPCRTDRRRTAR